MMQRVVKRISCLMQKVWYLYLLRDRLKFARKLGVEIGEGGEILSEMPECFGSEPYLIKIGNNVRITHGVRFITHDGGVWVIRNKYGLKNADIFGNIVIKDNVHIGMGVTIMPGVTIGNNVVIGCGAVVTKDIPDNSIAVGVPARVIKNIEEYYEKHRDTMEMTKHMSASEKRVYLLEKYNKC